MFFSYIALHCNIHIILLEFPFFQGGKNVTIPVKLIFKMTIQPQVISIFTLIQHMYQSHDLIFSKSKQNTSGKSPEKYHISELDHATIYKSI